MSTVSSLIELLVGAACLGGAAAAWRRALRGAAVILALAGIAAAAHATAAILT